MGFVRGALVVIVGAGCMVAAGAVAAGAEVPGRQVKVGVTVVAAGASGEVLVACPAGAVATGGGYLNVNAVNGGGDVVISRSQPDGTGWRVSAHNAGTTPQVVQGYAVCADAGSLGGRTVALGAAAVPAGGRGTAQAACPAGSTATGGGFINLDALNGGADVTVGLTRSSGSGWAVDAYNPTAAASTVWAWAVCVAGQSGLAVGPLQVQPGAQGSTVAQCPAGTSATGGGFHNVDTLQLHTDVVVAATRPVDAGWEVIAYNPTAAPKPVFTYAVCR